MKTIIKTLTISFIVIIGLILYIISNQIGSFRAFIISSGSMEPGVTTGSLVVTKYTSPNLLKKNDVITFIPPIKKREFVTHRITNITNKENLTIFKTKGDNNKNEDPWMLAGGGVVGKVIFTIPYLGSLLTFTQTKPGIIFFILVPAFLIVYYEITTILKLLKTNTLSNDAPKKIAVIVVFLSCLSLSTLPTHALLADRAFLKNTIVTVCTDKHPQHNDLDNKKIKCHKQHKDHGNNEK